MSAHSTKSRARHPDTTTFAREQFKVGHVTYEVCDHPVNGATFALVAGEATHKKHGAKLFSGHVSKSMPRQLRVLADRLEEVLG